MAFKVFAEQDGSVAPDGIFDGRTALMASIHDQALQAARQYADQAVKVAEKLKPGTYDSVAALALTSIAHSLTVLASSAAGNPDRPS